jgi:translation initiation factor 1 (eIF-1/SUI1)
MADPMAAVITQLKNIQVKTGKTLAELHAAVAASGAVKHGDKRSWLMERFKLGYGDANTVVHWIDKPMPDLGTGAPAAAAAVQEGDPLDAIYTGAKAGLRPLHEAVMAVVRGFGSFEEAPKKSYISLRRKKQFATLGPATKDSIEIGLNAKDLAPHSRLKQQPPGSMCNATTRIGSKAEIDAALNAWLKQAYDAAA